MSPIEQVVALLAQWLPGQRWFAAKGRSLRSVEIAARTPLPTGDAPGLEHLLVAVTFDDDDAVQLYQLLVAIAPTPPDVPEHAVIGAVDGRTAYDGLWDGRVTAWLLAAVRAGTTVGELHFVPEPGATIPDVGPGRVLGAEQSNTSVTWEDRSILKLFRRVLPGVNPDLELHRALRAQGSTRVAALQGAIEGSVRGEPATLGMLQDFAAGSTEGWALALRTVRAAVGAQGGPGPTDPAGETFTDEAAQLGETVAVVHAQLHRTLGVGTADPAALAAGWHARLDAALPQVPGLARFARGIRAAYDAVGGSGTPVPVQRVHGDLHLGQTLRTAAGWLVIDFEGEPSAPLAERTRPDSTLRDVAGMLRSFDYAAFHEALLATPADRDRALDAAGGWAARTRSAFCDGYTRGAGSDPRERAAELRAFELDKAVYEAVYDTRSRPSWAPIPLASIERLVGAEYI